jgi:hypothetical protein
MPKPRRKGNKSLKPCLHIFCEGEKTEPNYLNGYLNKFHSGNRLLKVVKVEKTPKNTPLQLVEVAVALKNDITTPEKDSFWVVYDREGVSKYSDGLHSRTLEKAVSERVNVAITNVCFEVWLLLHFNEVTAQYSSYEDLLRNSKLKENLKSIGIVKYDKACSDLFSLISNNISDARRRASKMNKSTLTTADRHKSKPYNLNPYTQMHKLLDAIDDFVVKYS